MTPEVHKFLEKHKSKIQGNVIEVGSLNVNGSVRDIVEVTIGVDLRKGKVSIGWVAQKIGELGSLEFEPYRVP